MQHFLLFSGGLNPSGCQTGQVSERRLLRWLELVQQVSFRCGESLSSAQPLAALAWTWTMVLLLLLLLLILLLGVHGLKQTLFKRSRCRGNVPVAGKTAIVTGEPPSPAGSRP